MPILSTELTRGSTTDKLAEIYGDHHVEIISYYDDNVGAECIEIVCTCGHLAASFPGCVSHDDYMRTVAGHVS